MNILTRLLAIVFLLTLLSLCKKEETKVYDWNKIQFPSKIHLQSIQMLDDNIGFVGGDPKVDSFIMKIGVASDNPLLNYDTVIVEPNVDFIYNYLVRTVPETPESFLFKTTNGGDSWQPIVTPFKSGIQDICFIDEIHGFVTTPHEGVFKTVDGGVTWRNLLGNLIYIGESIGTPNPYNKVVFLNKNYGFVYSDKEYPITLITNDGGENWTYITDEFKTNATGTRTDQIATFPGKSDTVYISNGYGLFVSGNSGVTWDRVLERGRYYSISFMSPQVGYAVDGNTLLKTIDGGQTWLETHIGYLGEEFIAVNENEFYVAELGWGEMGSFVKITDVGEKYYEMTVGSSGWLNDWCFPSDKYGYAVGSDGLVLKYENNY